MGVLGEMFPGRKIRSEAGEAGSGQGFRLGPIDLESGVVEVHRAEPEPARDPQPDPQPEPQPEPESDEPPTDNPTNGTVVG
jgi:hypothetical protein